MKLIVKSVGCSAALLALCGSALAQDMRSASEKVVACQDVADSVERLACFEAAALELSVALAAPIPPVASAATAPGVQAAAPSEAQVTQSVSTPTASAAAAAPIQQASTDTSAETDAPQSSLPSWIPRITFGSDRDVEKEPDEFETKLTRIQVNKIGRHFFTTAEGHVWKQKSPEDIRAPSTLPADVVIYQNITGGLRLKIVETNRSYPVRRVE